MLSVSVEKVQLWDGQTEFVKWRAARTYRSEEPVSKLRYNCCGGVPMFTGQTYS